MKKLILMALISLFLSATNIYGVEDKVIVIVNDEAITKAELDAYVNLIKLQIGYDGWANFEMTEEKALENLIEDRLILQEAQRNELEIENRLIESRLADTKRRIGSESDFTNFLASQGISLSDLRQKIKEKMLSEKLVNIKVRSRIFVSPREVTEFYKENIEKFYSPEQVRLESIFVGDEDTAQKIYQRLKEGTDFASLQKKYSEKSNLGLVSKGQLLKQIEDVIFALKVGEFSTPVEISDGYYVFLVKEKIEPSHLQLIDVQDDIHNMLLDKKFNAKLLEFINELKSKSYLSYKA